MLEKLLTVRWQDLLDIGILAFIFHRGYLLFRHTNALQILLGLIFLWFAYLMAKVSGLIITSWILQGMGAVIVITIIVIFRREIREILISTNPLRLFWGNPQPRSQVDFNSMSEGVFNLAKAKIGALIVFPRREFLDEFIYGGTLLNSHYSPSLLMSIFQKESPLHDGAAVIRGDRIEKVGCFLPLSYRTDLPEKLGTRHRAALGLSENSDAVVVVVSEERGEVSLIQGENIGVIPNINALSEILKLILVPYSQFQKNNRRFARLRSTNLPVLITSIILAAVIWFLLTGQRHTVLSVSGPIQFTRVPAQFEMVQSSAKKVEAQVSGPLNLINFFKLDQVAATISLENAGIGINTFPITEKSLNLPVGLNVMSIEPSAVMVVMEERQTKYLNIVLQFVGEEVHPDIISRIKVVPAKIKVEGPMSVLADLDSLETEPIQISRLKKLGENGFDVAVVFSPFSIKPAPGEPQYVRIVVE